MVQIVVGRMLRWDRYQEVSNAGWPISRALVAVAILAVASVAPSQGTEPQLRGPGGQLEAAGAVAAVFQMTMSTLEGCSRSTKYKARATQLLGEYVDRNKPVFMSVMQRLPALAQKSGGDSEVTRIRHELEVALGQFENVGRGVADATAQRAESCPEYFERVQRRELDLEQSNAGHLRRLGL